MRAIPFLLLCLLFNLNGAFAQSLDTIRLQERYRQANVYISAYQFDKALSLLSECYIKDPQNADYLLKIAYCYKDKKIALRYYEQYLNSPDQKYRDYAKQRIPQLREIIHFQN